MDDERLSRTLAYALRHGPEDFGLALDEEGFVGLDDLLAALRRQRAFAEAAEEDVRRVVESGDKRRFEISGGRVRALYGHSARKIRMTPEEPPDRLYHGTSPKEAGRTLRGGISPMGRRYVHLSADPGTALAVGRRHSPDPVILSIDAARAWSRGVRFYRANEDTWLCDQVAPEYVSLKK
ncbi:MAG: RNA 2'-phosphotransferase [Thermodesulfovibrionales bacterium]